VRVASQAMSDEGPRDRLGATADGRDRLGATADGRDRLGGTAGRWDRLGGTAGEVEDSLLAPVSRS
jgi:hypothetical protein